MYGGSDGAPTVARVFPHYRRFVEKLITQGIAPASYFHFSPFPADKLTYKSDRLVEFVTPSDAVGLGTYGQTWLAQGNGDITGFAMIIAGNNLNPIQLSIRLPPTLATLGPVIIEQAEHEAAQPH